MLITVANHDRHVYACMFIKNTGHLITEWRDDHGLPISEVNGKKVSWKSRSSKLNCTLKLVFVVHS